MGVLAIALALFIGCALAYRFGGLTGSGPRWAQFLAVSGAGIGLGAGITAVVFFVARTFVPVPLAAPIVETILAAWLAWEVYRVPRPSASPAKLNWTLAVGVLAVLGFAFSAFAFAWEQN